MSIGIIIQAREQSTRLPNKVLYEIKGKTILEHIYLRCLKSNVNQVIIATTENSKKIQKLCKEKNMECFVGDEDNVLKRFYDCELKYNFKYIIRITSDCPFVSYKLINKTIKKHIKNYNDFTTNAWLGKETYPDGFDITMFDRNILSYIYSMAEGHHKEHVVSYIMENPEYVQCEILKSKYKKIKDLRLTLDNEKDLLLTEILYNNLYDKNNYFEIKEIYKFWKKYPEIFRINYEFKRNESYYKQKENK